MNLSSLLNSIHLDSSEIIPNIQVTGLHFDSRKIDKGNLFVAINGTESDGHHYIDDAVKAGASVIIGETALSHPLSVPYFKVENSRIALAQLASSFYGNPATGKTIIGITGTNGKTTTCYLLRHILEQAGIRCSLIGTVSHYVNGQEVPSENTTPDALTLHKLLHESQDPVVILEVSSHGLEQHRVEGIQFDYALFTNLSHDHLNYHHSLYDYFITKTKLFDQLKSSGKAFVSRYNNEWSNRMIDHLLTQKKTVLSVGIDETDDFILGELVSDHPCVFTLQYQEQNFPVNLPLYGLHNAWNASLTFLTAYVMGIAPQQIKKSLQSFPGVPGRFELYDHPKGAQFIVDYAHTPDAVLHCLKAIQNAKAKRIFHIFGFRGNGDPSKRQEMIKISSHASHQFILTLDDTNGVPLEEMEHQLHDLQKTFGGSNGTVIMDRTLAIQYVWGVVEDGDWVFISGKGPEHYKQNFHLPATSDRETIEFLQLDKKRTELYKA